jgi:hypothetical protein
MSCHMVAITSVRRPTFVRLLREALDVVALELAEQSPWWQVDRERWHLDIRDATLLTGKVERVDEPIPESLLDAGEVRHGWMAILFERCRPGRK